MTMQQEKIFTAAYVIKPEELLALNYLDAEFPRPSGAEWINRGTDQKLKASTVEMLQRTLFRDLAPPSVVQLHRSAGLRVFFPSEAERNAFAAAFSEARAKEAQGRRFNLTAIFDNREEAEAAVAALVEEGFPEDCVSLVWRVSQLSESELKWQEGHSPLRVASAIAGGGVAGALLGIAVLAMPGVGLVATAGALTAAVPSVASLSGIIGATGGAITRMLDDHDVDDIAANYFEQQILRGKIFVSVKLSEEEGQRDRARAILVGSGGKTALR